MERKHILRTDRPIAIDGDELNPESVVETWTLIHRIRFALYHHPNGGLTGNNQDSICMAELYRSASEETKQTIDRFLRHLCGLDMSAFQSDGYMAYLYDWSRDASKEK
jgi:hypothetical protein